MPKPPASKPAVGVSWNVESAVKAVNCRVELACGFATPVVTAVGLPRPTRSDRLI